MWIRLRQICLVAAELAPVEEALCDVLDVKVCHRDPLVRKYGLENALFPVGNQLLEVVAPTEPNTAGGRYLDRRGGDGGYMWITQCDNHPPRKKHVAAMGIRTVTDRDTDNYTIMQLHPADTAGTFFEIDEQKGDNAHDADGPWFPAGDGWQTSKVLDRVDGIVGGEIQSETPGPLAKRWAEIAELNVEDQNGHAMIQFDNAQLRFVEIADGRPEGLGAIDIKANDKDAILASADARGAVTGDSQITICGTRINLV